MDGWIHLEERTVRRSTGSHETHEIKCPYQREPTKALQHNNKVGILTQNKKTEVHKVIRIEKKSRWKMLGSR